MKKHADWDGNFPGDRIKIERQRLGYTQEGLAKALGVNRLTMGSYEAGRREPGLGLILDMGDLGADLIYIVFGLKGKHHA